MSLVWERSPSHVSAAEICESGERLLPDDAPATSRPPGGSSGAGPPDDASRPPTHACPGGAIEPDGFVVAEFVADGLGTPG